MKYIKILVLPVMLMMAGCEKLLMGPEPDGSANATFEYLWQQFDEEYSLFDVKAVDWDSARAALGAEVHDDMSAEELFDVCGRLTDLLHDGHVNLISGFDVRHDAWLYRMMTEKSNIDPDCVALHYLGPDYHTLGGLCHNDIGDGVLYIRYASFSNSIDSNRVKYLVDQYAKRAGGLKGIVFDIRQNGGGNIANLWNMLAPFRSHGQLLYTTQSKVGKGHFDYGKDHQVWAYDNPMGLDVRVAVLTDRGCYSAASFFTFCAKEYDNFWVVGDTTGGGLGLPRNGQLPNGWYYRMSVSRTLSADGNNWENGVPPDEVVLLDRTLTAQGVDNVIERAKQWILE